MHGAIDFLPGMFRSRVRKRHWVILSFFITCCLSRPDTSFAIGFTRTEGTTSLRTNHTATLLDSGKVLVTGGVIAGSNGAVDTAELYDPKTGKFSPVIAHMIVARQGHTATKLTDGRILIVGGENLSGPLNSAEIFVPSENGDGGAFIRVGDMTFARKEHTATLISGNRVLVAGGMGTSMQNTAEIFNPAGDSGSFVRTGDLDLARRLHTATLLPDGKVLIAGGGTSTSVSSSYVTDKAAVYTPASDESGSFRQLPTPMTSKRREHAATLLKDGTVLLTGGLATGQYLASAEIFNPSAESFQAVGPMRLKHGAHTATLLNSGKVLIAGGYAGSTMDPPTSSAEVYDPATRGFSDAVATMTSVRAGHKEVMLTNGTVLLVSGITGGYNTDSAEIYDPASIEVRSNSNLQLIRSEEYDFGQITIGVTTIPVDFVMNNTGISSLAVSSIEITGTDSAMFSITSNCGQVPFSLAVGGSCSITVRLTPTVLGGVSGLLVIKTGDNEKPVKSVKLTAISEPGESPNLMIKKSHTDDFLQRQKIGAQYTLEITNIGNIESNGVVNVSDPPVSGLNVKGMNGTGWSCQLAPSYTCTRQDSLQIGQPYPPITVTVEVDSNAPPTLVNVARVEGGGDFYYTADNVDEDLTTILPVIDAACGSSDGKLSVTAPSTNLCTLGTSSGVAGNGPWSWTCLGVNGGANQTCSAPLNHTPVISGTPSSIVGVNQYYSFTPTGSDVDGQRLTYSINGKPDWAFFNTSTGTLYGTPTATGTSGAITLSVTDGLTTTSLPSFTVSVVPPEAGTCGPSNEAAFTAAPTTDLCISGAATAVTGNGPWFWSCSGRYGGTTTSCSANLKNFQVTIQASGTGNGTVTSSPAAISCISGSTAGCAASFPFGTTILLTGTPDWKSILTGWTACSGAETCTFSVSGDTNIVATFSGNYKVKIANRPADFSSLQDAYDGAGDNETLLAQVYTFLEKVTFNRAIAVKLVGGKDANYLSTTGFTTIQGGMTIEKGSVDIRDVIIR